jgi:hypothetical protein
MRKILHPCLIAGILFLAASAPAQTTQSPAATPATTTPAEALSTSTDIFLMAGSVHSSIWLQETYSKVNTVPWYTTSSVGYTYSF